MAGNNLVDKFADPHFALARYLQNGEIDSTFGGNGTIISGFAGTGYSIAIQDDGKILLAGSAPHRNHQGSYLVLMRYLANGKIDKSFGTNGKVVEGFEAQYVNGNSVALQADGKIVVAGYFLSASYDFLVARYKQDGKIDSAFGIDGKVSTDFGDSRFDYPESVAIQANGKIVVAGFSGYGNVGYREAALVRYRQNGKPDSAFGTNGKVLTNFGRKYAEWSAIVIQTDGKIVVAGNSKGAFTMARYNNDSTAFNANRNLVALSKQRKIYDESRTIYISPNPVKDMLRIRGLSSSLKTISIIDNAGRTMQKTVTANTVYSFNVKQLSAGIYFIRIDEGEKIATLKFIKE